MTREEPEGEEDLGLSYKFNLDEFVCALVFYYARKYAQESTLDTADLHK